MTAAYPTTSIEHAVDELAVAYAPPAIGNTDASRVISDAMTSPLALDGWLEFNRIRWEAQPLRVRLSEDGSEVPAVHAIYYLNRKGQICNPPASTYVPMEFESTPTDSLARLDHQWLNVGGLIAEDMKRRGVAGRIMLPPEIQDIRPWQWAGFAATVHYRIYLDLPAKDEQLDPAAKMQIWESEKSGFHVERVRDLADAFRCIADTERRLGLTRNDLEMARDLVGGDALRAYVCYAPSGEPASARIVLHRQGSRAIDWLSGSSDGHLHTAASHVLLNTVLSDLRAHGATGCDFEDVHGLDRPDLMSIQGSRRVPHFMLETPDVRGLARTARDQWRYWRARWEGTGA